jgi:hypothetical protein
MKDSYWIRVGLAVVLLGAGLTGLTAAGCGGDDNGPGATGGHDASIDNYVAQQDSGVAIDTGAADNVSPTDGDSGASPGHAHIYVVHASETAPAFRFCFGLAMQADGGPVNVLSLFNALPDTVQSAQQPYPGLFPGTGGLLDDHGYDLSLLNVAAYAIDATKLLSDVGGDGSTERNCAQLVGSDGQGSGGTGGGALKLGTDYWALGIIPSGTLVAGTSWVFAITGCPASASDAGLGAEAPFCGA